MKTIIHKDFYYFISISVSDNPNVLYYLCFEGKCRRRKTYLLLQWIVTRYLGSDRCDVRMSRVYLSHYSNNIISHQLIDQALIMEIINNN